MECFVIKQKEAYTLSLKCNSMNPIFKRISPRDKDKNLIMKCIERVDLSKYLAPEVICLFQSNSKPSVVGLESKYVIVNNRYIAKIAKLPKLLIRTCLIKFLKSGITIPNNN